MEIATSSTAFIKGVKSSIVSTWIISANDCGEGTRTISSPAFQLVHPDGISSTSWAVDLSLRMSTENSAPVVAAFLRNESPAIKYLDGILCEFGIFFCLADDSSFHGFRGTRRFKTRGSRHGWEEFITVNDLEKKGLTANATLQVRAELTIFADVLESSLHSIACTSASD